MGERGRGIVTRFKTRKKKITQYKAISKANSVSKSALLMHIVHTISNQFRLASFFILPSCSLHNNRMSTKAPTRTVFAFQFSSLRVTFNFFVTASANPEKSFVFSRCIEVRLLKTIKDSSLSSLLLFYILCFLNFD